jgi:hypothetical protein
LSYLSGVSASKSLRVVINTNIIFSSKLNIFPELRYDKHKKFVLYSLFCKLVYFIECKDFFYILILSSLQEKELNWLLNFIKGSFPRLVFTKLLTNLMILRNKILPAALVQSIEIGLEQAPFVFMFIFFSTFEHVKSLLIMGPNNTKNSSLKCDFLKINYE